MIDRFFEHVNAIRRVLSTTATAQEKLERIQSLLTDADVAREFWNQLSDPDWLDPLENEAFFASPPPILTAGDGLSRFTRWPASKYLARVAAAAPERVAAIFTTMETDNPAVVGDLMRAARAMPVDVALSLVPSVCRAATSQALWAYFKDASDFCARLADGGEGDAAMKLAEALFAPTASRDQERPGRRNEYWYREGLEIVVPSMARHKAREFLPSLCEWLQAAIKATKHIDVKAGSDYSYVWRPAIEEHAQNHDYEFAGVLVGFARQGFEVAIASGSITLEEAIRTLQSHPYLVFKRMQMHLIGEFADMAPDVACQSIMERDFVDDYEFKHEYASLVGRRLNLLSPQERDQWFGWIDAGPDMSNFDEYIRKNLDREPTDQDRQSRIQYWQLEKLHWVRDHLEGERRVTYERMLAEKGEPEFADMSMRTTTRWGNESPMTVEQLQAMPFGQAVEGVASWQPSQERSHWGPNIEGLASTFRQYVATDPEGFSREALILLGKPAIIVRAFISQMGEAATECRELDLPAIFELCRRILERPVGERATPNQVSGPLVDHDWQWTRDEMSRLVENVCKARDGDVPRYPREDVQQVMWNLIEGLYRDHAESCIGQEISKDDPRAHDYLDLGINSPRGKAVGAGLEYARWVASHIKETDGTHEIVPGGFDAMPEVRAMMLWQIASPNRSLEAMSVIGSRLGLIYWIDKGWLQEYAAQLFWLRGLEETPPVVQGWAAWNAFLVWVDPHVEFYRSFSSEFQYAVEQTATVNLTERSRMQPMHRLGEHLMVLYGRGQLQLDETGPLRRFLDCAKPEIRRHAISFLGRSVGADVQIPEEAIERFMALWKLYWDGPGKNDTTELPGAGLFGEWFASGQFPDQWAIDCLLEFVAVDSKPEPDHAIVERLVKIANVDLRKSVEILDRMVRGDPEGWLESAEAILKQAMNASGTVREHAEAIVNYLGRRGHMQFGELLAK